jgi:hypothetical protein
VSKGKKSARPRKLPPGPLAKWRLSIAVGASALATGMPLANAAVTGEHLDLMLGRSLGAACLVYIALGKVNRMIATAQARGMVDDQDALDDGGDGRLVDGDQSDRTLSS